MTNKKHYLRWWDIAIVTLILFGSAIWNSTQIFLTSDPNALAQGAQFSADDNIYAIVVQSFELAIAFLYLKVRRFDFSQWKYQVTWKGTLFAAALFLGLALLMDIISIIAYGWPAVSASIGTGGLTMLLGEIDLSLIVFSLLNGFYEDKFTVCAGDILADAGLRRRLGTGYDIVLANIVADVIIPLAALVPAFLTPGGTFVCSGIIDGREDEVAAALTRAGFTVTAHDTLEEWHCFTAVLA